MKTYGLLRRRGVLFALMCMLSLTALGKQKFTIINRLDKDIRIDWHSYDLGIITRAQEDLIKPGQSGIYSCNELKSITVTVLDDPQGKRSSCNAAFTACSAVEGLATLLSSTPSVDSSSNMSCLDARKECFNQYGIDAQVVNKVFPEPSRRRNISAARSTTWKFERNDKGNVELVDASGR